MVHTTPLLKIRPAGGGERDGEVLIIIKDAFVIITKNELQVSTRTRTDAECGVFHGGGGMGHVQKEGDGRWVCLCIKRK